ncbi:MAG: hypothetical protein WEE66_11975 [Actinomycetota bacterium]
METTLPSGWKARLEPRGEFRSGEADALLHLTDPTGTESALTVSVLPRVVPQELVKKLNETTEPPLLVAAPMIGDRARALLRDHGISWLETRGEDYRIGAGSFFAERVSGTRRREANPTDRRSVADIFSGAALRVIRWLLIDPSQSWKVVDMADAADVTAGFVSRVFATLERQAYIERARAATRVTAPLELLDSWAAAARPPEERFERMSVYPGVLSALGAPGSDEEAVGDADYAMTSEVAAEQLAPYARWNTIEMYVQNIPEWDRRLQLEPVPRGGNVVLIRSSDPGVFDGTFVKQGMTLVCRPQLYVDLKRGRGPAPEAADFLQRQGLLWPA